MIQIPFEVTDGIYTLVDALWLHEDNSFSESEIEAMKQKRFDDWVLIITAPSVEVVGEQAVI